jgi:ribosomal protein S18 acetylase RimI-like enzyme
MTDQSVLDNPVWSSSLGGHAGLMRVIGGAARFPTDVASFVGVEDETGWADLHKLVDEGEQVAAVGDIEVPADWTVARVLSGVQMATSAPFGAPDAEAVRLGADDVPEMLDLVRRTEPGPFLPRTVTLGTYLGIRRGGALVAMAGERLRPPGWTEISAVCTDPAYRGQGLAGRLVRAVAEGIEARGELAFLHASADNEGAIRVYESLGFHLRRPIPISVIRPAGQDAESPLS